MFCRHCGMQLDNQAVVCVRCGRTPHNGAYYCWYCGAQVNPIAQVCTNCGVSLVQAQGYTSDKSRLTFILLGIFLGELGIHNFYAGYANKGIIQLVISLTLGWLFGLGILITFIWSLIDIITVTVDSNGNRFKD